MVEMVVTTSQYLTHENESVSSLAVVRSVEIVRYVGTNSSRWWLAAIVGNLGLEDTILQAWGYIHFLSMSIPFLSMSIPFLSMSILFLSMSCKNLYHFSLCQVSTYTFSLYV